MDTARSGITCRSGLNFTNPALESDARSKGVDDEALAGSNIPGSKWVEEPYQAKRSVFFCFESGGGGLKEQPANPPPSMRHTMMPRRARHDALRRPLMVMGRKRR